jgi:hypothetical protein
MPYGRTARLPITPERLPPIIGEALPSLQETPRAKPSGLPDADELGFLLDMRRQGIHTTGEHADLLDALTGVQPQVSTGQDVSRWAFLKPDGSLGDWRPPATEQEGALYNKVREHEAAVADDLARQTQDQTREQSRADLEAIAMTPTPQAAPDIIGMAQEARGRQAVLTKATGGSRRASPGMGMGRAPSIAERTPRPPMPIGPAFLLKGR